MPKKCTERILQKEDHSTWIMDVDGCQCPRLWWAIEITENKTTNQQNQETQLLQQLRASMILWLFPFQPLFTAGFVALIDMFKPHTHAILTTAPGLGLVFLRLGVLEGRVEDGPELLVRSSDSSVKVELTKDQNLHDKWKPGCGPSWLSVA